MVAAAAAATAEKQPHFHFFLRLARAGVSLLCWLRPPRGSKHAYNSSQRGHEPERAAARPPWPSRQLPARYYSTVVAAAAADAAPPIVYEQRRGVSLCQTRSTAHRNSAFRPKLRDIEAKCNLKHPKFINARRSESPCPTTWLPTRLTSAGEECAACDLKCMLVSAGGKRIAHIFHRHRACAQRLLVVRNARVRLRELRARRAK